MQQTPARSQPNAPLVVLGGVFDPVHNGHLQLARRLSPGLEDLTGEPAAELRFLPAGQPPHKAVDRARRGTGHRWHRLEMLKLAAESLKGTGDPIHIEIDDRELHRDGPSYSVLSFRELRAEYPERRLYFLMGSDNIVHLGGWFQAEELLELCTPLVVPRPRAKAEFEPHHLPWLDEGRLAELNQLVLPGPPLEISSSDIRRRIASGASIDGLVPTEVARYIEEHQLYSLHVREHESEE